MQEMRELNMIDPAYDHEDYQQDAQVALLCGKLRNEGVPTAIANSKRSSHRRLACRQRHDSTLRQRYQCQHGGQNPLEAIAGIEQNVLAASQLYQKNPRLLNVVLLRALGLERNRIAEITGCSLGTISRAAQRAALLCEK